MQMACDKKHYNDADYSSHGDRHEFTAYEVKIKHERHTGRNKEESHIVDKETTNWLDRVSANHTALQQESKNQHAPYAAGNRHARHKGEKFT